MFPSTSRLSLKAFFGKDVVVDERLRHGAANGFSDNGRGGFRDLRDLVTTGLCGEDRSVVGVLRSLAENEEIFCFVLPHVIHSRMEVSSFREAEGLAHDGVGFVAGLASGSDLGLHAEREFGEGSLRRIFNDLMRASWNESSQSIHRYVHALSRNCSQKIIGAVKRASTA